jgi:hypothetical protein
LIPRRILLFVDHCPDRMVGECRVITRRRGKVIVSGYIEDDGTPATKHLLDRIRDGGLTGLSVRYKELDRSGTGVLKWELEEVSIVKHGLDPKCRFAVTDWGEQSVAPRTEAADEPASFSELNALPDYRPGHVTKAAPAGTRARIPPGSKFDFRQFGRDVADTIAPILSAERQRITELTRRIEELERDKGGASNLRYCGVWRSGESHERGDMVTHQGQLWYCHEFTDQPPGTDAWQLMQKRGK